MAWDAYPTEPQSGAAAARAVRVDIDGEEFEIRESARRRGEYHYTWLSGPDPGYGFTMASSDGRSSTMEEHREIIRDFLGQVDPETGHL